VGTCVTDPAAQRANVAVRTYTDCDEDDPVGVNLLHTEKRVAACCDAIAKHICTVSPQQYSVGCMRLHFKVDETGTLWLKFASIVEIVRPRPWFPFWALVEPPRATTQPLNRSATTRACTPHRRQREREREREKALAPDGLPKHGMGYTRAPIDA